MEIFPRSYVYLQAFFIGFIMFDYNFLILILICSIWIIWMGNKQGALLIQVLLD